MKDKKIIVLGGNGFIGTRLTQYLADKCEVYSLDISEPSTSVEGVNYMIGDYFDIDFLINAINGKDIIIHSLGLLNPTNSIEKYRIGYERELLQLIRLCEGIDCQKQKLVFISSGGTVYGKHDERILSEEMSTKPVNHYGNVKLCMENVIRVFAIQNGLDAVIARVANPYGPGQDYRKGVGFIDAVIKNKLSNSEVIIWGDGSVERDYIYIDDVCSMIYALCAYKTKYFVYNVSTGIGTTQKQILEIVDNILGNINIKYNEGRSVDVKHLVLSNERIMEICTDSPRTVSIGIKEYINYLLSYSK